MTARALLPLAAIALLALGPAAAAEDDDWPWPDSLDAVAAAPDSHRVLIDNDRVRVLEVVIPPGVKEPMHTHRWPSVMIVDRPARIRYYNAENRVVFETPADRPPPASGELSPDWMGPEGKHAVENTDSVPFHALRIELKD